MSTLPAIAVRIDPSAGALIEVAGAVPADSLDALRAVVDRTVSIVGPHLHLDLSGCRDCDPDVLAYLRRAEDEMTARGGRLVVEGVATRPPSRPGSHSGRPGRRRERRSRRPR